MSRLFSALDTVTIWTAYFSAWIVPVDEAITYFRVKFEPLRNLVVSLFRGLAPLREFAVMIVTPFTQLLIPMVLRMGGVIRVRWRSTRALSTAVVPDSPISAFACASPHTLRFRSSASLARHPRHSSLRGSSATFGRLSR